MNTSTDLNAGMNWYIAKSNCFAEVAECQLRHAMTLLARSDCSQLAKVMATQATV